MWRDAAAATVGQPRLIDSIHEAPNHLVVQQEGWPAVECPSSRASQPLPLEATRALTTPRMGTSPVAALTVVSDRSD